LFRHSDFVIRIFGTMDPQDAIELARDAMLIAMLVSAPVLIAGMLVGLIIGLLQALTQIQEQTVAFVPKLVVMVLVLALTMPWLITMMVQYSQELITSIPENL
jgi:flagellar biosynthetic protein FliQ